jgi:hypothetical protein
MSNQIEDRREFFISQTRRALNIMGLKYTEMDSKNGSYYFKVDLNNDMSPCIRISDHLQHNQTRDPFTLLYTASKNAKRKDLSKRIERSVRNIIDRSNRGSFFKKMDMICSK